jgi:archaellum component FlaC
MDKKTNLSENLNKLSDIASWFDEQQTVDVEEGLVKVKEAAGLIKESKLRLKAIENEFEEIKKEIDGADADTDSVVQINAVKTETTITEKTKATVDEIPF